LPKSPKLPKIAKLKIMPEEHRCSETDRLFPTTEAARASEARFREVQAECDAGRVPRLRKGDVIYVETELYLGHGVDDFRGGLAELSEMQEGKSKGQTVLYVRVVQQPDTLHNWHYLAAEQKKLRAEHGKGWAYPDPDHRPEFNKW
jgi:hypothetical protein